MSKKFIPVILGLALVLVSMGCNLSSLPVTGGSVDEQNTQVAQAAHGTATQLAVEAILANILTQTAAPTQTLPPNPTDTQTLPPATTTNTTVPPTASPTPIPPTATATLKPTNTPVVPTSTPFKTFTPIPPTATPIPCNAAAFIADVTVPDGTVLSPGASFTKIWRLKNVGTCTWNTQYDLVFASGSQMGGPSVVDFSANVIPGQEIDLSVNMQAPTSGGSYRSNWKLRDDKGNLFGVGGTSVAFYAQIKVTAPSSGYPLDMAATFCNAAWTSGIGSLACPSPTFDSRGFVLYIQAPHLENGQIDDEPALLTNPQAITDGFIKGKYPAFRVLTGYHFRSIVGCEYNATNCDVNFVLDYQIGDGAVQNLGNWHEKYDGQFTKLDVDLSSLAGKDVKFILTVYSNGVSNGDLGLWLAPRIIKP